MKREEGILLVGSVGLLAVLGFIGVKRFLRRKRSLYNDYYSDFHRHFEKRYRAEDNHGIEYFSVR